MSTWVGARGVSYSHWEQSEPVADPEISERGVEGPKNMKLKPPRSGAIFFMTIFYRRGGMAP